MLTNAQLQARIEALENTLRVVVNQDHSRIQPVGGAPNAGYNEGNGRAAASNHIHPIQRTTLLASNTVSISTSNVVTGVIASETAEVGDYVQGFAFIRDESKTAITVSDTKGNHYAIGTPVGVVGTEVYNPGYGPDLPAEGAGGASTWVIPFGSNITHRLTNGNTVTVTYPYGGGFGGGIGDQEFCAIVVPGCGDSGPSTLTSGTGSSSSPDSGVVPLSHTSFAFGLLASFVAGGGIVNEWDPTGWSVPGLTFGGSFMTVWTELTTSSTVRARVTPGSMVNSLLGGTPSDGAGWVSIVIPFIVP